MPVDRLSPRYALNAEIAVHDQTGRPLATGRATNLSRGGVCAEVDRLLVCGASIEARIALVFDEDSVSEPLVLPARVVWCTPIGGTHQVGLSFLPAPDERLHYLDMFIRFLAEGRTEVSDPATDPDDRARRLRFDG